MTDGRSSSSTSGGGAGPVAEHRAGQASSRSSAGPATASRRATSPGATAAPVTSFERWHDAHAEAGQIHRVPVAVLGHLAADQGAAGLAAPVGHPGHDRFDDGRQQPADADVVEEEQRIGALHGDVVDAHGHQVDADGVEAPGGLGDLELGAHAVGGRHQHRRRRSRRAWRPGRRSRRCRPAPRAGRWSGRGRRCAPRSRRRRRGRPRRRRSSARPPLEDGLRRA